MNIELRNQINFLKYELDFERSSRVEVKLIAPKKEDEDWEPIGGYKSRKQRIQEAEAKVREDANNEQKTIRENASSPS